MPETALVDEKVSIHLLGFEPNQPITVRAWMRDDPDRKWESFGFPYLPTTCNSARHPISGDILAYGGSALDDAHARSDSWSHVLAFLEEGLKV